MWYYRIQIGAMLMLVFILQACGFRPLYGHHSADQSGLNVEQRLAGIRVEAIANRLGQEFHNQLRDALNPYGQPAQATYRLRIELRESRESLVTTPDLSATREDLTVYADFVLIDLEDKPLFRDTSQAAVSYNIFLINPYNDLSTRRDAHERAIKLLAEEIRNRLAVFLNRGS